MEGVRHKLPLTLEAVLSGRPMTQSAIRATLSLTRKQVWEGQAPASEQRLVKHMQPRDWTALLNALPTSRLLTIPTKAYASALRFQLGAVDGRPDDPNAACVCGHQPLGAAHAISCTSTGAISHPHPSSRRRARRRQLLRPTTPTPTSPDNNPILTTVGAARTFG